MSSGSLVKVVRWLNTEHLGLALTDKDHTLCVSLKYEKEMNITFV